MNYLQKISLIIILTIVFPNNGNGTTTANFLEIDVGSRATSMGGAYVSLCDDPTAIFWNPAGLTFVKDTETSFMYQPYWDDTSIIFMGIASSLNNSSYIGAGFLLFNWGDIEQTDLIYQDGTGVIFNPSEYSFSLSYARKFVDWFSFGSSVKFISSNLDVGRVSGNAFALDFGVMINTDFFSSNNQKKGLKIGMSISNYGSRLKYDNGIGLLLPNDISEDNGNWDNLLTQVYSEGNELPLNFRIGCSLTPINSLKHSMTLSLDAVHPNNNSEFINAGFEYARIIPGVATIRLNSGYKGLFMQNPDKNNNSEYGPSFGCGLDLYKNNNPYISLDYSYRTFWTMPNTNMFSIGLFL
tara:strand:+ start:18636 stop:19697 length:1062 start_codon:yes stop_codon:yes gene_type:complete